MVVNYSTPPMVLPQGKGPTMMGHQAPAASTPKQTNLQLPARGLGVSFAFQDPRWRAGAIAEGGGKIFVPQTVKFFMSVDLRA